MKWMSKTTPLPLLPKPPPQPPGSQTPRTLLMHVPSIATCSLPLSLLLQLPLSLPLFKMTDTPTWTLLLAQLLRLPRLLARAKLLTLLGIEFLPYPLLLLLWVEVLGRTQLVRLLLLLLKKKLPTILTLLVLLLKVTV